MVDAGIPRRIGRARRDRRSGSERRPGQADSRRGDRRDAEPGDRLDALVNNAGVFMRERVLTPEGLETTFAVNALAPYRVTRALAPLLRPPRRVVNVASIAHFSTESVDWENLQGERHYDGYAAYSLSKLGAVLLARGLADHGFEAVSLHPGVCDTSCSRRVSALATRAPLRSTAAGARPSSPPRRPSSPTPTTTRGSSPARRGSPRPRTRPALVLDASVVRGGPPRGPDEGPDPCMILDSGGRLHPRGDVHAEGPDLPDRGADVLGREAAREQHRHRR